MNDISPMPMAAGLIDESNTDFRSLSLFQKILLATDGTVTDLIGLYTGEKIRVKKIAQSIERAGAPHILDCAGMRLLSRKILLSGEVRNYLYADSLFVVERLSVSIQQQLLESDQPIGLMWKAAKLETYREIVERKIEACEDIVQFFGLEPRSLFISRTYVIHHGGRPLGLITEKWPASYFL